MSTATSDNEGKSPGAAPRAAPAAVKRGKAKKGVELPASLTVRDLASKLNLSPVEVIKQLIRKGIMANVNQVLDYKIAASVVSDFGLVSRPTPAQDAKKGARILEHEASGLKSRPPVVTIMGHVDHGKTSLLDAIRQTNVTATEAGGITQHIGAYQVKVDGREVTFLDTPGHEAFTAMRARGAQLTDIAVIVVAADDGVMPQTLEAISHAKAAAIPIVVAINKVDKPDANVDKVKQQLADAGLVIEEWGGDTICVPVSAKKKTGISELLENLLVVADVEELKANPNRAAMGRVIEAKLDKNRGPLATLLVQTGTLKSGDVIIAGNTSGRVKAMFDDKGRRIKRAEPSTPVEVLGLSEVPQAGDSFSVSASEREARAAVEQRQAATSTKRLSLDSMASQIGLGQAKELNIVLKADVQGSLEAIVSAIDQAKTDKARARVIHAASGSISESDILLAIASGAIVVGFNTRTEPGARKQAEIEGVDIRLYNIIYDLVNDLEKALQGLVEPKLVEVVEGRGEVIAVFSMGKKGRIAGVRVTEGKIRRGASIRVLRGGKVLHEATIGSLKRFKEDTKEVAAGFECGIGIEGYNEIEVGDFVEGFSKQKVGAEASP